MKHQRSIDSIFKRYLKIKCIKILVLAALFDSFMGNIGLEYNRNTIAVVI